MQPGEIIQHIKAIADVDNVTEGGTVRKKGTKKYSLKRDDDEKEDDDDSKSDDDDGNECLFIHKNEKRSSVDQLSGVARATTSLGSSSNTSSSPMRISKVPPSNVTNSNSDSDSDYIPGEEAISISSDSIISIASTESEVSYNETQQMEEFMEILHDPANRQQCIAYQHNFEELALVTGDNIEHIGETEICLLCHCRIIQGLHLVRQNFICPNIKCKTPRIYHLTCLLSWMLVRGRVPNCHICNHPDLRDD